jgi:hypothetical protein
MNSNNEKRIRALVSGLMANDTEKINSVVRELTESIIPEKEPFIMGIITESFKGETDV